MNKDAAEGDSFRRSHRQVTVTLGHTANFRSYRVAAAA